VWLARLGLKGARSDETMTAPSGLTAVVSFLVVSFTLLYGDTLVGLARDWSADENYSHGFLIIPLAAYLVWERRDTLRRLPVRPASEGLVVVAGSLLVLWAGEVGAELFLSRVAMLGTLAGGVLFVLGWQHLKALAFPLAVLLLMVPLPAILFNQVTFPLQLVASRIGVMPVAAAGIPVLREGNIIVLANTTLQVAEACSGIRSLVSLLTIGIVYGYLADRRAAVRTIIALSTVPVAIIANGARVAGTGLAAHYYGAAAAEGFFHAFSGWIVFVAAFLLLFLIVRALLWLWPADAFDYSVPASAA
jgi:exosortase